MDTTQEIRVTRLPTGIYSGRTIDQWRKILSLAMDVPHLRRIAENYLRTQHPACLNAMMDNATGAMWLAFYS